MSVSMYNFFKIHKMGGLRGIRVFVRLYKLNNAEKNININKDNNNNEFEIIQKRIFFFFGKDVMNLIVNQFSKF